MRTGQAIATLLLIPTLAACGSSAPPDNDPTGAAAGGCDLADSNWNLSGTGADLGNMAANNITLDFAKSTASGDGGVSTYVAKFTSQASGALKFTDVVGEKVTGQQGAMQAQAEYLKTLESVTGYTCTPKTLALFAGDRQVYIYVPS